MTSPKPTSFSHTRYDALLEETITTIRTLGTVKGGEYAGDTDRLANFRRNAQALGLPMEVIWSVYYVKHHDAVMQYVRDLANGTTRPRAEPIAGRVHDMLTYLVLLLAILEEGKQTANFVTMEHNGTGKRLVEKVHVDFIDHWKKAGWLIVEPEYP